MHTRLVAESEEPTMVRVRGSASRLHLALRMPCFQKVLPVSSMGVPVRRKTYGGRLRRHRRG